MPGSVWDICVCLGRGELLLGERDVLRVLLGKVILAVPVELHRHPLTMNSAEHVEVYIGAKPSHPLGRYLHNLAALSPGVK